MNTLTDTPAARSALTALLRRLDAEQYDFVTATPATHARVLKRPDRREARSLRDVIGWSLPFRRELLPSDLVAPLEQAGLIASSEDGRLVATFRVSRVRGALFVHSAYPTLAEHSVFLGPDSYRFADYIIARMADTPLPRAIMDYGAGAGVGGIVVARHAGPGVRLTLADINPEALFLASINADHAGIDASTARCRTPADAPGLYDLIVTHPPFMMDRNRRAYRDGGDLYGGRLSVDWVLSAARKLNPGGRIVMHTGVSIVGGKDLVRRALEVALPALGCRLDYRELDPDIFSEDLDEPAYAEVERIAAVGACVTRTPA